MSDDPSQKIAALEVKVEHLREQDAALLDEIKAMRKEIRELNGALTKWKGIAGGIAIVMSLLWTVATFVFKLFGK